MFQDSELVSGTPWWPAALAPTIAYGAAAPKPSAQAPSTHHGRRRLRLVWAQFTGGASGEYPPPPTQLCLFFNACTLLIISLNISIYLPKLPPRLRSKRRCCCRPPPPCRQPLPPRRPAAAVVVTARQRRRRWITTTSPTTGKGWLLLSSSLSLQRVPPPCRRCRCRCCRRRCCRHHRSTADGPPFS